MYASFYAKYSVQPNQRRWLRGASLSESDHARLTAELITIFERMRELTAQAHVPAFLTLDVTMQQAKAMHLIQRTPGIRMSALATGLGVGQSTASGNVDRLAEMGLIVRHEDAADRRQVTVTLTDRGHQVLEQFQDLGAQLMRDLLASLAWDELTGLRTGLTGLVRALEQHARSSPTTAFAEPVTGPH
jgi:DNA-binding MarR family transcriptional regulator